MRRRSFFAVAVGAVVGLLAPSSSGAVEAASDLRPVWRKTATGWNRCRMFELKPGDVMRIERHPKMGADGFETVEGVVDDEPKLIDGQWSVNVRTGWTSQPAA